MTPRLALVDRSLGGAGTKLAVASPSASFLFAPVLGWSGVGRGSLWRVGNELEPFKQKPSGGAGHYDPPAGSN